jgi:CRP-like cAMP-binding protein
MRKVLFILGQLSDADVAWFATHGERRKCAEGTELIAFGTHIDHLYIILDGEMAVLTDKGIRVASVASGDVLGEMSLIDASPTSASIRVERDATVLALPVEALRAKLESDEGFSSRFYRALSLFLAHRLRDTMRRLEGVRVPPPDPDKALVDTVHPTVASGLRLAEARFEGLIRTLAGRSPGH